MLKSTGRSSCISLEDLVNVFYGKQSILFGYAIPNAATTITLDFLSGRVELRVTGETPIENTLTFARIRAEHVFEFMKQAQAASSHDDDNKRDLLQSASLANDTFNARTSFRESTALSNCEISDSDEDVNLEPLEVEQPFKSFKPSSSYNEKKLIEDMNEHVSMYSNASVNVSATLTRSSSNSAMSSKKSTQAEIRSDMELNDEPSNIDDITILLDITESQNAKDTSQLHIGSLGIDILNSQDKTLSAMKTASTPTHPAPTPCTIPAITIADPQFPNTLSPAFPVASIEMAQIDIQNKQLDYTNAENLRKHEIAKRDSDLRQQDLALRGEELRMKNKENEYELIKHLIKEGCSKDDIEYYLKTLRS